MSGGGGGGISSSSCCAVVVVVVAVAAAAAVSVGLAVSSLTVPVLTCASGLRLIFRNDACAAALKSNFCCFRVFQAVSSNSLRTIALAPITTELR